MTDAPRIPPPPPETGSRRYGTPLDDALLAFSREVVRSTFVDALTTELVRLRCAAYHRCRRCASLRSEDALGAGLDETLAAKAVRYESSDLDDGWKAALRLADALAVDPAAIGDDLRRDLRAHFTAEQLAELMLDIVKWSLQKPLVALRLDIPLAEGLTRLSFDDEGNALAGGRVA